MLRIGMLTSGGDCQALNAAMRGVVKGICSKRDDVEIYGFQEGYKGLIYSNFKMLTSRDFSGILTLGGTILGTSRQPFKLMRVPDENGLDKVEAMKHTYHKLNLDCLVILGGNGTHKTANMLREEGLNIITLPKTIDNDLWGTASNFSVSYIITWRAPRCNRRVEFLPRGAADSSRRQRSKSGRPKFTRLPQKGICF